MFGTLKRLYSRSTSHVITFIDGLPLLMVEQNSSMYVISVIYIVVGDNVYLKKNDECSFQIMLSVPDHNGFQSHEYRSQHCHAKICLSIFWLECVSVK